MLDPHRPSSRRTPAWLRPSLYPALLVATAALCTHAIVADLALERMVGVVMVGLVVGLTGLERLVPYRRDWQPHGSEWTRDGLYIVQGAVFGGLAQGLVATAAVMLAPGDNGLPLWAAAPMAIVLTDLCTYTFHRFVHSNDWMWREHGVHHVTDKVNTLNANTAHFLDIFLNNIAALGPLLLLGFSAPALFIASMARAVQTLGAHANIDVELGWLGHVVMGPEHHRLHHSADADDAGNYGTIVTLWDRVFGTFRWSPGRQARVVGVRAPHGFPDAQRIWASALHPFVRGEESCGGSSQPGPHHGPEPAPPKDRHCLRGAHR